MRTLKTLHNIIFRALPQGSGYHYSLFLPAKAGGQKGVQTRRSIPNTPTHKPSFTIQQLFMIGIFSCLTYFVSAQGGTEVFEANNDLKRTIAKSEKLNTAPQLSDSTIEIPPIKYYIEPVHIDVDFEAKPIKPAKIKVKEPLEKLYRGYAKVGLGTYTRPYADIYYSSLRSKTKSWGVNVKHYSSLTNLKNVGTNLFSDNYLDAFYKHIKRNSTFYTNITYERNKFNYYGYQKADTLIPESYKNSKDTTKQVYQTVSYSAMYRHTARDSSKFSHQTAFDFYYLNGLTKVNELDFALKSNLHKFIGREEAGADVSLQVNSLKQPVYYPANITPLPPVLTSTQFGNTVLKINPYIKTKRKNFLAKVGAGIHADFTSVARFYFYPDLSASYSLFNNIFVPYVGITGGLQQNTFNGIRKQNPYVLENISTLYYGNTTMAYRNTNQRINFYGGFKGSISASVSFNLKAQFEKIGNMPLFVVDTMYSYQNKFNIVYDSIDKTTLSAQIGYRLHEKIKLYAKGEYYNYSTLNENYAWQKPNYKFSILGVYDLADKIIARLNLQVIGSRKTYSLRPVEGITPDTKGRYIYDLKPFVDANLGFEYRYNKRLSAFINFNNIVGKKYQNWTNYPVYTFNLLGGVTYSF